MDRISTLPDDLLCHILSFLPTKHAVATSILSSRWVNLWVFLRVVDLDNHPARNPDSLSFFNFVDRVLSLNQSPALSKFRLHVHDCTQQDLSRINGFIQNVKLRNVVEVDLDIFNCFPTEDECLKIPPFQSLEMLKISTDYGLRMPAIGGCFPNLRTFDVRIPLFAADEELTVKLFPSLPVLENLSFCGDLADCTGEVVIIGGVALKCLQVCIVNSYECDAKVLIDAPNLEYLQIEDGCLASYLLKDIPAMCEVELDVGDYYESYLEYMDEEDISRCDHLTELLQCLTNAKILSVSANTTQVICALKWDTPILHSLIKLEVNVLICSWILVVHWLGCCPNLKFLSVTIEDKPFENYDQRLDNVKYIEPDHVPCCLSLHVTDIEIKRLGKVEEEELLKYLLENAKVLQRFTVNSRVYIEDGILQ